MEIEGLSGELAGRMSSGLVCGLSPLEVELRRELLRRESMRSFMPWDEETIQALATRVSGDGRLIQGIGRLVSMLQRMYRRMPTMQEIIREAGDMLQRGPRVVALEDIERAVCTAFNLPQGELRGEAKSRNVSQPRILAMYLSRQHTSAAFSEIGRYFGDRNHSTVIAAYRRAESWLKTNQAVGGRGPHAVKVQEAIDTVENLLRIG
jgi:chromosomal replication initiator protein